MFVLEKKFFNITEKNVEAYLVSESNQKIWQA